MKLPSPVQKRHSRIEIIPLIDIMFFLLASFMMVSLQLDRTRNIKVNLPEATQARHDFKPDMLNIAVDKDGSVWLEKKPITLPDLSTVLSNRFRVDTNLPVYVSADRLTKEGAIQDVLERVRNVGVQKVAFMVGGPGETSSPTNAP
jgi:biopolymer transport protein ExbD